MDFTALMNQAAQNKQQAEKQYAQKKQRQAKTTNCQRVSSQAVKTFLLKKEKEEKQWQEEQEKARKMRVQARLEQSLNSKKGRKKSTDDATEKNNDEYIGRERRETALNTVSSAREVRKEKSSNNNINGRQMSGCSTATSRIHRKEASKGQHHKDHPVIDRVNTKTGHKEVSNQPGPIVARQSAVRVTKQGSLTKSKNSSTKPGAPLDFKQLLAVAEMNKTQPPGAVGGPFVKSASVANGDRSLVQESAVARGKKGPARDSKNGHADAKTSSKKKEPVHLQSLSKEKLQAGKRDELVRARNSNRKVIEAAHSRNVPPKQKAPSRNSVAGNSHTSAQRQDPHLSRKRGRPVHSRLYDEDGMDDFIDDGEEDVDVSKYIRDIFGYDRTKYDDNDVDCAYMESSFCQIEREEARSSKIAKLEDEVEFLKEQAELKEQRKRLLKQKKKR